MSGHAITRGFLRSDFLGPRRVNIVRGKDHGAFRNEYRDHQAKKPDGPFQRMFFPWNGVPSVVVEHGQTDIYQADQCHEVAEGDCVLADTKRFRVVGKNPQNHKYSAGKSYVLAEVKDVLYVFLRRLVHFLLHSIHHIACYRHKVDELKC